MILVTLRKEQPRKESLQTNLLTLSRGKEPKLQIWMAKLAKSKEPRKPSIELK